MESTSVATNLQKALSEIDVAVKSAPFPTKVLLKEPAEAVLEAYNAGQRKFGENYVDELVEKSAVLPKDIEWHMIGHLQSNKCKKVLEIPNLHTIESVDSKKLALKLNNVCTKMGRTVRVLIEVNISKESSKSGVALEEVHDLVKTIIEECKGLKFGGFMTMPKLGDVDAFKRMNALAKEIKGLYGGDLELSMGTSADFVEAIKEGATQVRLGTTIFGHRDYTKH